MNIDHLDPCPHAKEWLLSQPDAQTAWDACERPAWMIWYLDKTGCPQQTLVTISCRIARTVVHLAPPEALTAIEAAERWAPDPSEENMDAAYAVDAARSAYAARAAARTAYAAYDQQCKIIRGIVPECPKCP